MPIDAECPLCAHKGKVPDQFSGKHVKCPECCNLFVVAGDPVAVKTGGSHAGTMKINPGSGSAHGNVKIKPAAATHQGMAKPGSHHGTAKSPMGGSHYGQQKSPAAGSHAGQQKSPTSGSGQGNQKIKASNGSAQGTQKKPPVKAAARNGSAAPFGNLEVGDAAPVRSRRRQRTLGNAIALCFWLLVLVGLGIGSWFLWILVLQPKLNPQPDEQAKVATSKDTKDAKAATEAKVVDKVPEKKGETAPDGLIDVSKGPAKVAGVQIRVMSVTVDTPPGKDIVDKDPRFIVKFQIENKGTARVLYFGWSEPESSPDGGFPILIDAATDIKYKQANLGAGVKADGQQAAKTLDPGVFIDDLLVFDVPPDKIPGVKIELPAGTLRIDNEPVKGKIKLFLPRSMWGAVNVKPAPKPDAPKPEAKPDAPKADPAKPDPAKEAMAELEAELKLNRAKLKAKTMPERREGVLNLAALGKKAAPAALDLAETMRKDPSDSVRLAAAEALGTIGPEAKAAVPMLIEALQKDEFPLVQAAAAESLGKMGPDAKEALPALKEALKSKEEKVREAAKEAAAKIEGKAAVAMAPKEAMVPKDDAKPKMEKPIVVKEGSVVASTKKPYDVAVAKVDQLFYIDRPLFKIQALTPGLDGAALIRTANDDKKIAVPNHVTFVLTAPANVYVAYDKKGALLPKWLGDGSWQLTQENFKNNADVMNVFVKAFPAGPVTLGGTMEAPASGALNHYVVFVKAKE